MWIRFAPCGRGRKARCALDQFAAAAAGFALVSAERQGCVDTLAVDFSQSFCGKTSALNSWEVLKDEPLAKSRFRWFSLKPQKTFDGKRR